MVDQIAVVTLDSPAATGVLAVTHPSITEPFSAAIIVYTRETADSADNVHCVLGYGFVAVDGALEQEGTLCAQAQDGATSAAFDANTQHEGGDVAPSCIKAPTGANVTTTVIEAAYSASVAGGVELNFTTVAAGPIRTRMTVILFAGLARAAVGTESSSVVSSHEDVGAVAAGFFRPNVVIFAPSDSSLNAATPDACPALGFAVDLAAIQQVCAHLSMDDAVATTDSDGDVRSANAYSIFSARAAQTVTVSSFDSTGYNKIASAGSPQATYLALKFSGNVRIAAANMQVAAATGLQPFNAFTFTPDLVFGMATLFASLDTLTDGATASAFGFFVTGRYGSRAYTGHLQEGQALSGGSPSHAHTRQEDVALLLYNHTGTIVQRATWAGPSGAGGFRLDFSTASAGGFMTALGIQLLPTTPMLGEQATVARRVRHAPRRALWAGGKHPKGLFTRILVAWERQRRAMFDRLHRRPLPIFRTPELGAEGEEPTGITVGARLLRGAVVGPGTGRQDDD